MRIFLILLLSLSLLACEQVSESVPEYPDGVPETAIWVGGADGGVFVKIEKNDQSYQGTVYAMGTGAIWYEGPLEYSGDSSFNTGDAEIYDGWDGDDLYLMNGERLSVPDDLR